MGVTYIEGTVAGENNIKEQVRFLVDSGATDTPSRSGLEEAGVGVETKITFTLADGTTVDRSILECYLILPQGDAHTHVILGETADEALLGAVTLEILGLVLNPFNRELQPMRMLLG